MNLESIVRPFQSPGYTLPAIRPQDPTQPQQTILVVIGAEGQGYTFNGNESGSLSSYMDASHKEVSRETHVNRITNPSDPSQFVDVEVIDKLTVAGNTGKQYEKTQYQFKNPGQSTPDAP